MKTIQNYAEYVVIPEKISQANIAKARSAFTVAFSGNNAQEIRLGSGAINDMCMELGIDKVPAHFTNESVQGLIIMPDPSLKTDEWLVGRSQAIVRERPE